jgi:enediyne biosynthesis protein E4
VNRREFLRTGAEVSLGLSLPLFRFPGEGPGFQLSDVSSRAGIDFRHNSGAYGGKFLPETLGSGCAFLDYDGDGWQDILLVNGMDWPGHKRQRSTLRLYRNNRNGTFTDVSKAAGLDIELYGMGVSVGDYNNDGLPDLFISCVGQSRLLRNTGKGGFMDVTAKSGIQNHQGFSTSALWFDYDRDGLLDLFVCNYVRWSPERDVFCSLDGKHKSYCTPEAYRGDTCWLFHNRGDGSFEDVTATSGIFDSSSKSLGVALFDYDQDGWPDLLVANDTQPNKLYKNLRNGKFKDVAVEAGLAFSSEGKARAGMGVAVGDFENSGQPGVAITNFDNEMVGLYRAARSGVYDDIAVPAGIGAPSRSTLGFGCAFFDADLDGYLDLCVANGHIDETVRNIRGNVGYAQAPHLFLNQRNGRFRDIAAEVGGTFNSPKVARGLAIGDFDRDGDLDLLLSTNNGPALLYRNDQLVQNQSVQFVLVGTKSNRDAVGARLRLWSRGQMQTRVVQAGGSYLSQSELPVTFGLGQMKEIDRLVIDWPSGRVEEFTNLYAGKRHTVVEQKGITALPGF